MQAPKSYLSTRSDLEGFWGSKTPFIGVHGLGYFLDYKHMFLVLLDDLDIDLKAKHAKL